MNHIWFALPINSEAFNSGGSRVDLETNSELFEDSFQQKESLSGGGGEGQKIEGNVSRNRDI